MYTIWLIMNDYWISMVVLTKIGYCFCFEQMLHIAFSGCAGSGCRYIYLSLQTIVTQLDLVVVRLRTLFLRYNLLIIKKQKISNKLNNKPVHFGNSSYAIFLRVFIITPCLILKWQNYPFKKHLFFFVTP